MGWNGQMKYQLQQDNLFIDNIIKRQRNLFVPPRYKVYVTKVHNLTETLMCNLSENLIDSIEDQIWNNLNDQFAILTP